MHFGQHPCIPFLDNMLVLNGKLNKTQLLSKSRSSLGEEKEKKRQLQQKQTHFSSKPSLV